MEIPDKTEARMLTLEHEIAQLRGVVLAQGVWLRALAYQTRDRQATLLTVRAVEDQFKADVDNRPIEVRVAYGNATTDLLEEFLEVTRK